MRDTLRRRVQPGAFVHTAAVHEQKRAALACATQRQWLAGSQGMDNCIRTMDEAARLTPDDLARLSRPGFSVFLYDTLEDITVGPVETWQADKVSIWHAGNHDNPFASG